MEISTMDDDKEEPCWPAVWFRRQTVLEEQGALVLTMRMGTVFAVTCVYEGTDLAALEAQAAERNHADEEDDGADHSWQRSRPADLSDAELEAWHNETIAYRRGDEEDGGATRKRWTRRTR
jgi:hypothetical protein